LKHCKPRIEAPSNGNKGGGMIEIILNRNVVDRISQEWLEDELCAEHGFAEENSPEARVGLVEHGWVVVIL
jgi:hypothetical protein